MADFLFIVSDNAGNVFEVEGDAYELLVNEEGNRDIAISLEGKYKGRFFNINGYTTRVLLDLKTGPGLDPKNRTLQ